MQFPVSFNQERYLFSEKVTGTSYALPVSHSITGELDVSRLEKAIAQLLKKHQMLRCGVVNDYTDNKVENEFNLPSLKYITISFGSEHDLAKLIEDYFFTTVDYKPDELVKFQLIRIKENKFVFTVSVHHVIADGVSIGVLLKDLSFFYNSQDEFDITVKDESDYRDYVDLIRNDYQENEEKYAANWKSYLSGFPSQTSLVNKSPCEDIRDEGKVSKVISGKLHKEIKVAAKNHNTATFTYYIALFQLALSRSSGTQDVVTLFQSSGRRGLPTVFKDVIGLFSNALILATSIDADETLKEHLVSVSKQVSDAIANESYPYHHISRNTGIKPSIGFNWYPIYEALYFDGCELEQREYVSWKTDLDLNIHCVLINERLVLNAHYNKESYSAETIATLLEHYEVLLQSSLKSPDIVLSDLDGLTDKDRGVVLCEPGAEIETFETERIEDAFLLSVEEYPEKIAVKCGYNEYTYQELLDEAKEYQQVIESVTAGKSHVVAVIAKRSEQLVPVILGVLLAKCSFAILDDNYPDERLKESIEELNPSILFDCADRDLFSRKESQWAGSQYKADNLKFRTAVSQDDFIEHDEELAYWLFTSGTTGKPKCISTNHLPLVHFLSWQRKGYAIDFKDKFSLLSGLSHDPVLRDTFAPLSVGATLYIPDDDIIFGSYGIGKWIDENEVTVLHITPQMGSLICQSELEGVSSFVRECFVGGDKLNLHDVNALHKRFASARVINAYGASETPQIMAFFEIEKPYSNNVVPIGQGIADVDVRLYRGKTHHAGIGEYGEIVIETPFMSNGYLKDAVLTEKKFSETASGIRRYYTGDYGYYDLDGNIVFLSRQDDQLKIRGYRIEPSDIVAHIEKLEPVNRGLVLPYGQDGQKLGAYIQLKSQTDLSHEDLNVQLKSILPTYMVPSSYIFLESFPLLPNGKVDRSRLPDPMDYEKIGSKNYVEPETEEEKQLVAVWEKALGITKIGMNDTFYDLGGDSLSAIGMMIEMEKLGINQEDIRILFQGGTLSDIVDKNANPVEHSTGKVSHFSTEFLTNILINCLRGILVMLVIAGHWMPGFLERLPSDMQIISTVLTPIFNLSTPGFSIVFGISLGYSLFHTYINQVDRFYYQIRVGFIFLLVAILFRAAMLMFIAYAEQTVTERTIFSSFHNVLGYYLFAIASIPVWFLIINYQHKIYRNVAILILLFIFMDFAIKAIYLEREQDGVLQLIRLYFVAKFAYFNMSLGAFIGFVIGYKIKSSLNSGVKYSFNLVLGIASIFLGFLWGYFETELGELLTASTSIALWKWCLYFGVVNVLLYMIAELLKQYNHLRNFMKLIVNNISLIGVLALPMFILQGFVLIIKDTLDVVGIPGAVGLILVLSLFFWIVILSVRKLYKLYF